MKAGELFMIQYCAEHGSFRVLPLHTCVDLARQALGFGAPPADPSDHPAPMHWLVIGYAATEPDAYAKMKSMKKQVKETNTDPAGGGKEEG